MTRSPSELTTNKICKQFSNNNQPILHDISVTFTENRTYALIGASGSGKSTFIHILAGLESPTTGSVLFNGNNIFKYSNKEKSFFLNQSIGLVFQWPYLIKELSVIENICLPGLIASKSYQYCYNHAQILLEQVGLLEKAYVKPSSLSGGQQQRVAIVRALFNKPTFLIADEPTGQLDKLTAQIIIDLLLQYQKEYGMGLIVSTHDSNLAERLQVTYKLDAGRLMPSKNTKNLYETSYELSI